MGSSPAAGGTQAVDRAAALIDLVVRADDPPSFTELSDETGLARSTTSRLLAALERTDLIERHPAGGYVAGPLFALHAAHPRPLAAGGPARPAGARRPSASRPARPCTSASPAATSVVHIGQVESTYLLSARDWNQVDVPAALLGARQGALRLRAAPRCPPDASSGAPTARSPPARRSPPSSPTIRRSGYAVTVDELETGLTAIAAPVRARTA